jgi:methanogenic corrinoid protein MtbC1
VRALPDTAAPTLNIAALARRTGVSADTLRKWEQRYDVLRPARSAGGQRRYSETDVARVDWLKARLAEGFRIGEAATLLRASRAAASSPEELRQAIVEATLQSDADELAIVLDQLLLVHPLELGLLEVVAPALAEIGALWERGTLSVAQEHLASAGIRAALMRLLAEPRPAVRGTAVLACAPGERHEIGVLTATALLRADGWKALYLGADCPVDDTFALARQARAQLVCFGATLADALDALEEELSARRDDEVEVVVGGAATGGADPRTLLPLRATA